MKEGINEEESEGYPINFKDCNLQPTVKPQQTKAMAAVPSSDTKLLKQQLKPLPYVTDSEALLSSEPKHVLGTCWKQVDRSRGCWTSHCYACNLWQQVSCHEQISYDMAKELKNSMSEKGLQSSHTMGLIESVAESYIMLLADWKALFKLVMTAGEYSIVCSLNTKMNVKNRHWRIWTLIMLK